jgi:hypothetical protein
MLKVAIAGLIKGRNSGVPLHPVRRALFLKGIRAKAAMIFQSERGYANWVQG